MSASISTAALDLIPNVTAYVKTYMSHFDGSHDFAHLKRVVGLAHTILSTLQDESSLHYTPKSSLLDKDLVTLGALLHDVGDRKYLKAGEDAESMVYYKLVELGADKELAEKVQTICTNVSWTNELKDPAKVQALIDGPYPELAVVQDADRLDALGAVGVGRVFTYGGARTKRGMQDSVSVFEGKLYAVPGRMKTSVGKEMAKSRNERMKMFERWWDEEMGVLGTGTGVLGEAGMPEAEIADGEIRFEETVSMEEIRRQWREELREELRREVMTEVKAELLPN